MFLMTKLPAMTTTRIHRLLQLVLCVVALVCVTNQSFGQTAVWTTSFPILDGYPWHTPVDNVLTEGSELRNFTKPTIWLFPEPAGDGAGGSVWVANHTIRFLHTVVTNDGNPDPMLYEPEYQVDYTETNHWRVLWLNKNGQTVFLDNLQNINRAEDTLSMFSRLNGIPNRLTLIDCSPTELSYQVTFPGTNFLRRISLVQSTLVTNDLPLLDDESIQTNLKPPTDPLGFTSVNTYTNEITRYRNR